MQLRQYAIDNASAISIINGYEIKKQIAEERLSSEAEKNIQISSSLTPMGSSITIISLKNNIIKVPVQTLVDTYIKQVNRNVIVVINLNDINTDSEKYLNKYLASIFIANEKKPIFIIKDSFKRADSATVDEFAEALRHAIGKRIKNEFKSDVVPNAVPRLKIDSVPSTSWYKVSFDDNMYL